MVMMIKRLWHHYSISVVAEDAWGNDTWQLIIPVMLVRSQRRRQAIAYPEVPQDRKVE